MANLDAIIAVYGDRAEAEADGVALDPAAEAGEVELVDATLVENQAGEATMLSRKSPSCGSGRGRGFQDEGSTR